MAGWADSGSSRGRGGGGFVNRGGANNNMNTRWRESRPAQLQQQHQQQHQHHQHHQHQQHQQQQHQQHQQQHQHQQHRYRPVNDNDQSSHHPHQRPAEGLNRHRGQGEFSNSTRRPQPTRPPQALPTFTDNKSPSLAANANATANEPDDKARRNAANFECNVCFDMADDPVVTKCGHLFCWECLYQWLHVHSQHRECPVCKGQVADDAIIPIYGRGGSAASVHAAPPRPTGARVESSRQQQQQAAMDWHMVDGDEDVNPFDDLHRLFGASLLRDAMMSVMTDEHTDIEGYDDYTNPYHHHHHGFDEDYHYDLLGSSAFASALAGSSWGHGHHDVFSDDIMETFDHATRLEPDFVYRGGRRQRGRARGALYADRSFEMVTGSSSSASYRDTGAGPHHINNTGGSSRLNGGWTERRGRSNRNLNSGGGGRGMQNNSRRQGANYN